MFDLKLKKTKKMLSYIILNEVYILQLEDYV